MKIVGGLSCICSKSSRFVEADISPSGKKVGQMRALVELMAATRGGLESLRWAAPTNQGSCSSLLRRLSSGWWGGGKRESYKHLLQSLDL